MGKAEETQRLIENNREFAFQEQCYLSFHKQKIFEYMQRLNSARDPSPSATLLDKDHVISLYSENSDSSALMSKINAYDGAQDFFNLDSSVFTQLKPIVELYKVYPDIRYPA